MLKQLIIICWKSKLIYNLKVTMTYNSKLKNCSSYKPPEGKFSWAIALGDLVKKTKKNLEGIDSSVSMNDIVIDGKCWNKDERLFQKSNTYRLMGLGRCSSSFESRNSTWRFATNKVNSNSIDSHDSSNHNIAASFDDNQNLNTNFKININYLN